MTLKFGTCKALCPIPAHHIHAMGGYRVPVTFAACSFVAANRNPSQKPLHRWRICLIHIQEDILGFLGGLLPDVFGRIKLNYN